ncbi:MAG: transporter substrate-binding domain-containing protein [Pseudomonadota bacterium]
MKKSVYLILAMALCWSPSGSAQEDISLMANTSPPYSDKRLPDQGLALELVRHVFAGTEYQPVITIDNWSRALEGASLGVYDGLAAAWFSDTRDEVMLFSEPYLSSKLIILKLRTNPSTYNSLQDLAGGRLGVRVDYAYGVDFAAIPNLTLVEENHLIQNLLKLLNGSVDFVIGDRRTIIMQLNEYLSDKMTRFEVLDIPLPDVQRHVAISREKPGHKEVIAQFNKALEKAQADGSVQAIVTQWDERLGSL